MACIRIELLSDPKFTNRRIILEVLVFAPEKHCFCQMSFGDLWVELIGSLDLFPSEVGPVCLSRLDELGCPDICPSELSMGQRVVWIGIDRSIEKVDRL